jgi:hypothetical protein
MEDLYSFVFRAMLTEEALDNTQRMEKIHLATGIDMAVSERLPLTSFDEDLVARAKKMATVYIAIAAFENTIREFISKLLLENKGEEWWSECVSQGIRQKADSRRDEEARTRWHTPRGDSLINYTEFGDLSAIVGQNWPLFVDYLVDQEWFKNVAKTVERSRNVIMHSGELGPQDVERVGTVMRDWINQVGA